MELTETWRDVFPDAVRTRYSFAETRSAAAIMQATTPRALDDLVAVLEGFELTWNKLTRAGGNRSVISAELDQAFRLRGWREAQYKQTLTTTLAVSAWNGPLGREAAYERTSTNEYGGHKIDNVLERAALDVEWNPKDGNLDRDISNYLSLYDAGVIDVGVLLVRSTSIQPLAVRLIQAVKGQVVEGATDEWKERVNRLPDDPYKTTTTANYERLTNRLKRGDGRGCPLLAIGITDKTYRDCDSNLADEIQRVATGLENSEK